jgi:predicted RND superfamily exporter protein
MRRLMLWGMNHAWLTIFLTLGITIFAAYQALYVHVDSSTEGMMIEGDPAKDYYQETLKKFGSDNVTVVFIQDKDLFTPAKLATMQKLVDALQDIKGVSRVESLFSVTNFKGVGGSLETNPLLDGVPRTLEEAKQARADALRNPNLLGLLISKDGTATAINLFIDVDHADRDFNSKFSRQVDKVLAQGQADFSKIFQIGISFTRRTIADSILGDQVRLVPLAVIILILTIVLALRSLTSGLMPVCTAGVSTIWTFGFMSMADIPLNVLTVIVPSLLMVIGSTEDIHMVSEYLEGMEETGGDRAASIRLMADKLGLAVFFTAITTLLGFASIIYNDITMLVQFGIVASFSLFVNPLITFTLGPALLYLAGPKRTAKHEEKKGFSEAVFAAIANGALILVNHPTAKKVVIVALAGITLLCALTTLWVKVDNDFMGYFKKDSDIRVRFDTLRASLAGANTFIIRITSGTPGTFKQAASLAQVAAVEEYLQGKGWFEKTQSLADQISLIHREMNDGDPKFYRVPESSDLISQYLLFLRRDEISRFVTSDFSEVAILVRHSVVSSSQINGILPEMDRDIKKILNPHFKFAFTGEYILINKAAESLIWNSVGSLGFTLFVVFLCMYFLFWSFKAGLLSLVPNVFPIIVNFGLMGILNIPLNVGTAMVADIAIGIAVDDTIHFMTRYNREMRLLQNGKLAVEACIRSEIRPIICSSLALALSFAMLGVSNYVPVIQFGLLSAEVMVVAIVGELLITPILLQNTQLITLWDMIGLKLQKEVIEGSKFFKGLSTGQIKKVVLLGRILEKKEGELAITQGEPGSSMHLLLEGEAEVVGRDPDTGRKMILAQLKPGDIFGEIALVEPGPRSADVRAVRPLKYLEIDWEGLKRVQRVYPRIGGHLFLNLSRILGQRLVQTDRLLLAKIEP